MLYLSRKIRHFLLFFLITTISLVGTNYYLMAKATIKPSHLEIVNQASPQVDLLELAKAAYQQENYHQTIEILSQAREQAQAQSLVIREAVILNNLALAQQKLQQNEAVKNSLKASFKLINTLPESTQKFAILAQAQDIQGKLNLTLGQAKIAWKNWQTAAENYQTINNQQGVIRSQINQAQALQVMGRYRRAKTALNSVQERLVQQPDTRLKSVSLRSLGNTLFAVGELDTAQTTLEASLKIARNLELTSEISSAFLSLGNISKAQSKTEEAIAYYRESAAIAPTDLAKIQADLNLLSLLVDQDYQAQLEETVVYPPRRLLVLLYR